MVPIIAAIAFFQAPQRAVDYPIYETDKIAPSEFKERRNRVMAKMEPGTVAVFFTNPVRNRNNDVDFMFRGDSDFLYLTGFEEPDAALVLVPDGVEMGGKRVREMLFVNEADQMSLTWLGYRMGSANIPAMMGIDAGIPNRAFTSTLATLAPLVTAKKAVVNLPPDPSGSISNMNKAFRDWMDSNGFSQGAPLRGTVRNMRGIKSPAEIALIKKCAEISARGHIEAIRSIEPGMREWEVSALVKYMFGKEGCEYEGYPPICGSGPNSTILHYQSNRKMVKDGEVMCMDTAGEYHGYSADVTRSFPINGKWSPEQRAIYNVVLKAQERGIAMCKKGVSMGDIENAIRGELSKGLIALGVIKTPGELGRYYMHGFGHGLGLDVHDPVPNPLQPGAVLTVEPGIYIKEGSPCDKKWWNIGIRIEDDIWVTDGDPVNLSIGAPRDPDAIERLMKDKGIGNQVFRPAGRG